MISMCQDEFDLFSRRGKKTYTAIGGREINTSMKTVPVKEMKERKVSMKGIRLRGIIVWNTAEGARYGTWSRH